MIGLRLILPLKPDLIFERKSHFSEVRETAAGKPELSKLLLESAQDER